MQIRSTEGTITGPTEGSYTITTGTTREEICVSVNIEQPWRLL